MRLGLHRRPPFTVISYVAVNVAAAVATFAYWGPDRRSLIGVAVFAVAALGLIRGLVLAWAFLLLAEASFYVGVVLNRPVWWWWVVPIKLMLLALLLSRPTWRHVRRDRAALA